MIRNIITILILSLHLLSDELALEDDFAKKGEISFGMGFDYINVKSNGIKNTNYVLQTVSGDFVEVPLSASSTTSQDIVSSAISASYGLSSSMSIFGYLQGHYAIVTQDQKETETKQFDNLSIGLSYKLKKEDDTPAFFTKFSTKVVDKVLFDTASHNKYFTTLNATLGTYKTIDPATLMLETSYIYNKKLKYNNETVEEGDVFILSPTFYFAINPYITINFGVDYKHFAKDKRDGVISLDSYNQISKGYGLNYEFGKNKVLSFDYENSDETDSISLNFNYTLQ